MATEGAIDLLIELGWMIDITERPAAGKRGRRAAGLFQVPPKVHALYAPLPYAMRLRLFEALPVTSVMTTRQMGEYMDAVQKEYRAMGIALIDPEARKYAAEFGE